MTQTSTATFVCLVLGNLLLAGCASNKPPADQVFLMPAPAVYEEGRIDPFGSSALPADSPPPCILYATDRVPTTETERFAYYSDERTNLLRLGEARIEPAGDQPLTWAELRRISLLKDRSDRYPLQVGSVDEYGILGGYVLDGALRVPKSLTLYQSSADSALSLSKLVFRRQRAGEALIGEMATEQASRFLSSHPRLRVIDVSNAEGAVSGSGHGYLRESPWVSSDVVLSLRYDLAPEERGLTRAPGSPIWAFPDDYLERAGPALDRAESVSPNALPR